MIWFNLKGLEKALVEGSVSDKEGFNYLLANVLVITAIPYLTTNDNYHTFWLTPLEAFFDIVLTVIMLRTTYDINSTGDNKDYLKRFLSLSLVSGVRLISIAVICIIPVGIILLLIDKGIGSDPLVKDIRRFVITIVLGIVYYFMLTNSFRRVSQKS